MKPKTREAQPIRVPYVRNDDFAGPALQPIWQWSHVPVGEAWSLAERAGFLRLRALPATSLWDARNTLTQRSIGPRSTPTALLETGGMADGDTAGLALFNRPYAWIGVERTQRQERRSCISMSKASAARASNSPARALWLRAECDFLTERAQFSYSLDGARYVNLGAPLTLVFQLTTFQGVRYALFNFNATGVRGGVADFDSFEVAQPNPRGLMRPIPYGEFVQFTSLGSQPRAGGRGPAARRGQSHRIRSGRTCASAAWRCESSSRRARHRSRRRGAAGAWPAGRGRGVSMDRDAHR